MTNVALEPCVLGVAGVVFDDQLDPISIIAKVYVGRAAVVIGVLLPVVKTLIAVEQFPELPRQCFVF